MQHLILRVLLYGKSRCRITVEAINATLTLLLCPSLLLAKSRTQRCYKIVDCGTMKLLKEGDSVVKDGPVDR